MVATVAGSSLLSVTSLSSATRESQLARLEAPIHASAVSSTVKSMRSESASKIRTSPPVVMSVAGTPRDPTSVA